MYPLRLNSQQICRVRWILLVIVLVAASCGDQEATSGTGEATPRSLADDSLASTTEQLAGEDDPDQGASVPVEENETGEVQTTTTGDQTADEDPDQQPPEAAPPGLLDQELAILGADRTTVEEAIAEYDGVITVEIAATATYQVSFPVASFDELLAIREQLEALSLDVALVPTIESP